MTAVCHHDIDFGERVHWTPPDDVAEFYIWSKLTADNDAMRWRRLGGWDIANNRGVSIPDAPGGRGINISNAEVSLDWAELLRLFDGYDPEIFQITTLDADGRTAGMHGGHIKVTTPDGTVVERMEIAVIDRRIVEVRARIAWFEESTRGNVMPRAEFW